MISIQKFTFNPFQENTYLLFDESKSAIVVDPGCYEKSEEQEIQSFIDSNDLSLDMVINTHCHIDHILGNAFFYDTYDTKPIIHELDLKVLQSVPEYGHTFGINVIPSPDPEIYLQDGDIIDFGNSELKVMHIPGHAPGHVVLINEAQKFIIGGDVLFYGSIGRTDLPYGDHDTLIQSIKEKLLVLDEDYKVYPGHGPATYIGFEKKNNPFLRD